MQHSCVKDVLKKLATDKTKLRKRENSPRKTLLDEENE